MQPTDFLMFLRLSEQHFCRSCSHRLFGDPSPCAVRGKQAAPQIVSACPDRIILPLNRNFDSGSATTSEIGCSPCRIRRLFFAGSYPFPLPQNGRAWRKLNEAGRLSTPCPPHSLRSRVGGVTSGLAASSLFPSPPPWG